MRELGQVALAVLSQMPRPAVQVCGPLTTGGFGTLELNTKRFRQAVAKLQSMTINVFDQMPFQDAMWQIIKASGQTGYCRAILDDFYAPIFRSGLISHAYFLSDWESSIDASWERQMVKECQITIEAFPDEWFES